MIGAIVGITGLFWTITGYFILHSRSQESLSPGDSPAPSITITVSGSGVGVGNMYGGQITQGVPSPGGSSKTVELKR